MFFVSISLDSTSSSIPIGITAISRRSLRSSAPPENFFSRKSRSVLQALRHVWACESLESIAKFSTPIAFALGVPPCRIFSTKVGILGKNRSVRSYAELRPPHSEILDSSACDSTVTSFEPVNEPNSSFKNGRTAHAIPIGNIFDAGCK